MDPTTSELSERLQRTCVVVEQTLMTRAANGERGLPAVEALRQLAALVCRCEADRETGHGPAAATVSELGTHGLVLLGDLREWAATLELDALRAELGACIIGLAGWVARCGGRIKALRPVVDAAAQQANDLRAGDALAALDDALARIAQAVTPELRSDPDKTEPARPWRRLLLNRAIVATRTHDPERMEAAFDMLLHHLPEEGPGFFREGMARMVALDSPPPVREVMQRYFDQTGARRLH